MLSLKLVRSLVLGDAINTNTLFSNHHTHSHHDANGNGDLNQTKSKSKPKPKTKTYPLLIFLPTNELIKDTYRLCTIAREMGMNLHPNPSLSHIIFSWPTSSPSPSSSSSVAATASFPSLWSSTSTSTWSLSDDFVPLPFPSFTYASTTHLQCFVHLSKGLFKLVFCKFKKTNNLVDTPNNWNCSSLSLFSRITGDRIDTMDRFCRVLAGMGWAMFKSSHGPSLVSGNFGCSKPISVYLFRKIEANRLEFAQWDNNARVRELRLPSLDFKNAPLRILQYILLMTDNVFYLA